MKNVVFILIILTILVIWFFYYKVLSKTLDSPPVQNQFSQSEIDKSPKISVIAQNLDTPWAIAFLPDKSILVTERVGRIRLVNSRGQLENEPVAILGQVKEIGEGGLLGITLHPDFSKNKFIYLYYTYLGSGQEKTLNRVSRMIYQNGKLTDEKIIIDNIPGAPNHNGGRIKFGPDNLLYITTGDAQDPSQAQDKNSLAGKILRVRDDGQVPPDNPFNNLVYSYGHRNPQGLAWDAKGNLWSTEHGPSGGQFGTGNDEINKIEAGKNYGWPETQGDQTKFGMEKPIKHSGINTTWAPAGSAFVGNSLFFAGLRGQTLYEAVIEDNQVKQLKEHFKAEYGRIREVILGPDDLLYIATSNRDGRGNPDSLDDKVIRIDPQGNL
ncbi:PQQ-dependent sugar dehydrogenase [Candidatus Daviesbacteria bacterium]|nr:PQQ-dependent sugar dehydrogenase [Candidatus Daviesbacteria bacterium]